VEPEDRPTPEEMLDRARAEEAARGRGRLKIWFGASPGVGKTYAMLEGARARRAEGVDVVIGWVETHGRVETERLAEGLERIPPRLVEYRGLRLKELDVDAAIARRPALLLVDELAHENAPGSRHSRRWQDVEEILAAGIDVHSTLNVQHLESQSDVVAGITNVRVRETVPDSVFEAADEIELVDLPPDDLRERLRQGKVYVPRQAERAIDQFFRKGNLIALRELALQRAAQRVDAQMTRWRSEQGIQQPWPTRERILVIVGPSPRSAGLVRAAYRMARSLRAPWIALTVDTPRTRRLPEEDRVRVAAHLAMAERLGAETASVSAEDPGGAALAFARQRNVTRIVVGRPRRGFWRQRLRGSVVERLVRDSGPIDVVVTTDAEDYPAPVPAPLAASRARAREYAWAVAAIAAATAAGWVGRPVLAPADVAMTYLLAVLFVAARLARGPAILASFLAVAAFDFFFVPPFFTFIVYDTRNAVTFAVLLVTAGIVSGLTHRIRAQAEIAHQRERHATVLHMMSRSLAIRRSVRDIAEAVARHVEILLEARAAVLLPDAEGKLVRRGGSDLEPLRSGREMTTALWVLGHGKPAGSGTDTLASSACLHLPVAGRSETLGVLVVALDGPISPSWRQLLDVFLNTASLALEQALLAEEAERAQLAAETERLRSALLSIASHDLRTPLAAIAGAATTILDADAALDASSRRELVASIREEADRLTRLVNDLLEITRIESGSVRVRKEWHPVEELVGAALSRLEGRLQDREVAVSLPRELLMVPADAVLVEQLLVNLIENAAKHTPRRTPIDVTASADEGAVRIEVADRGPGIPPGEEAHVFDAFHRARGSSEAGGHGLGLAVCRAVVKAHGGEIGVEARPGGGAVFRVTLPAEGAPPDPDVEEP
jgi:two-component system sensor histidine kinase KdpD